MASVQKVYNAVRDLVNKQQKGFITPQVFNSLAEVAQMNVYNEFFEELVDAKRISRQGFELGRDKSVRKRSLEDLAFMVKEETVSSSTNNFKKPEDLSRIISIRVKDSFSDSFPSTDSRVSCELLYDVGKMNAILGSNLSTPTEEFPVAMVSKDIEVFPSTIDEIVVTYYQVPTSLNIVTKKPSMLPPAYNIASGVFNPQSSRDFMLPEHCVPEMVSEIAKMIGVRLRDPNVLGYASREEAAE
jgi:hypothetical protein